MADDIYTKLPIMTRTAEHVLPNALGGRLVARDIIDRSTNSRFGSDIDASLEKALHSLRVILHGRSDRGADPAALTGLVAEGGTFDVLPGGRVYPQPQVRKLAWEASTLIIDATVPNEKALRQMLRKEASARNVDVNGLLDKIRPLMRTRHEVSPELSYDTNLWATGPYRATAKAACNLFARTHASDFREVGFDEIRAFVLTGTTPEVVPVQADEVSISDDGLGHFDHLIRVSVSAEGAVTALVIYYGHLAFVVKLGSVSRSAVFEGKHARREHARRGE